MNIAETLLAKLSEWRLQDEGTASHTWTLAEHGCEVTLQATRHDSLGSQLTIMTIQQPSSSPWSIPELTENAKRIADRATGLLEPLRLLEVDSNLGEALLRSEAPASKSNSLAYYEVKLNQKRQAELRRYSIGKASGSKREQVPFVLTHEAIAKLVGDIVGK